MIGQRARHSGRSPVMQHSRAVVSTLKQCSVHIRRSMFWPGPILIQMCPFTVLHSLYTLHVSACHFRTHGHGAFLSRAMKTYISVSFRIQSLFSFCSPLRVHVQHARPSSDFETGMGISPNASAITRVHGRESSRSPDGRRGSPVRIINHCSASTVLCANLHVENIRLGWYVTRLTYGTYQTSLTDQIRHYDVDRSSMSTTFGKAENVSVCWKYR